MAAGQPLGQMIIELGLDSSSFSSGMKGVNQQIKTSMTEMKAHLNVMGRSGEEIDKLKAKQTGLTSVITAQSTKVELLNKDFAKCKTTIEENQKTVEANKKAYEDYKKVVEGNTDATEEQKQELKKLKTAYDDSKDALLKSKDALVKTQNACVKATGELGSYENQLKEVNIKLTAMESSVYKAGTALTTFGGIATKAGKGLTSIGKTLTVGVSAPLLAVGTASIKAASDWESAFAGVKKTVDEIVDANGNVVYSYDQIEESLMEMSERMPATTTEIAGVAEAAGQLGIATDHVTAFTEVMINLGVATNLTAEDAASSLAKMINITGMSADNYENLGSSIVALGNSMATTEADIVNMATRMASAGTQTGLAETDILGVAAAMSSLGVESQAGGSAMSRTINKINSAVISGGDKLTAFSDTAGMTATAFQKAWEEDAAGALVYLVAGLSDAGAKGEDLTAILSDMGIESTNDVNAMMALATSSTVLSDALNISRGAWDENSALAAEAATRYATFESQLQMVKNKMGNVAIEAGGPLMEAMSAAVDAAGPLIDGAKGLAESFSGASTETQQMIITLGLVAVAAGPVLSVTGSLISGIGSLSTGAGKAMEAFSLWSAKLTVNAAATSAHVTATAADTAATKANTAANAGNTSGLVLRTAKVLADTAASKVHAAAEAGKNLTLKASNGVLLAQVTALNTSILTKGKDTVATVAHTAAEKLNSIQTGISTKNIIFQTAATIAKTAAVGAATTATGLLAAATKLLLGPIGWAVAAITLLVAGVTAAVKWLTRETEASKELSTETEALAEAHDALTESLDSSQTSYDDNIKAIETEAEVSRNLVDRISELAEIEDKSAQQKKELAAFVGILNNSMEGLNLQYDEQADALSIGTDEIYRQIDALEQQAQSQAAQERYLEIAKERLTVEEQLTQVQDKITEATGNTSLRERERKDIVKDLTEQEAGLQEQLESLASSQQYVSGLIVSSANEEKRAVTESTQTILEAYGSLSNAYDDLGDRQQAAIDGVLGAYETMTGKLSDLSNKIKLDHETSWASIQKNQQDTIAKTQEFSSMYAQLMEAGVSQSYLNAIGATGPESIPLLKDMLKQGTDQVLASQSEWQNAYGMIGNTLTDSLVLDDTVKQALNDYIVGESGVFGTLQGAINGADLNALGSSITEGVSAGILESTEHAIFAVTDMADATTEAARTAWDINSPSGVFKEIGGYLTEGLAAGITGGESLVSAAMEKLTTLLDIKDKTLTLGKQAMEGFAQGLSSGAGQVYAKAREISNEVTRTMKNALDIHSPSRIMRDEVGKNIALGIAEGITQNKDYAKKSAEEIADAVVQAAQKKLDNTKVYNELTLADEVAFWDSVRNQVADGTQAKIDADKKYFDAKKSLNDEIEKLNQKALDLETDYAAKIKKVNESLQSNMESLQASYDSALESRIKSITSSMSLFEEFTASTELTTADLLNNLNSQVLGLKDWSNNLKALEKRGITGDMLEELEGLGTSAAGEIALMTEMTDEELAEYVALWKEKQKLATKQATKELEPMAEEVEQQIYEMRIAAAKELEEYKNEFVSAMAEIGEQIQTPLKEVQTSLLDTMSMVVELAAGTVSTEADKQSNVSQFAQLASSVFQASASLPSDFTSLGANTVEGMIQGLQSKAGSLYQTMTAIIREAIQAAKDEAQIHSPSRVMMTLGSYFIEGFGVGMENMQSYVEGKVHSITSAITEGWSTDISSATLPAIPATVLTEGTGAIANINRVLASLRLQEDVANDTKADNANLSELMEQMAAGNQKMIALLQTIAGKDTVIDKSSIVDVIDGGIGDTQRFKIRRA